MPAVPSGAPCGRPRPVISHRQPTAREFYEILEHTSIRPRSTQFLPALFLFSCLGGALLRKAAPLPTRGGMECQRVVVNNSSTVGYKYFKELFWHPTLKSTEQTPKASPLNAPKSSKMNPPKSPIGVGTVTSHCPPTAPVDLPGSTSFLPARDPSALVYSPIRSTLGERVSTCR